MQKTYIYSCYFLTMFGILLSLKLKVTNTTELKEKILNRTLILSKYYKVCIGHLIWFLGKRWPWYYGIVDHICFVLKNQTKIYFVRKPNKFYNLKKKTMFAYLLLSFWNDFATHLTNIQQMMYTFHTATVCNGCIESNLLFPLWAHNRDAWRAQWKRILICPCYSPKYKE